jgi:hypothetical protein
MSIEWQGLEMWALGIFGFFVTVGAYPFSMEDGALTLLDRISNVEFDKDRIWDAELRCLVSSMLALSTQRANLQQSFNHPFLREYTGECKIDEKKLSCFFFFKKKKKYSQSRSCRLC